MDPWILDRESRVTSVTIVFHYGISRSQQDNNDDGTGYRVYDGSTGF